jgi:hypothetical protein
MNTLTLMMYGAFLIVVVTKGNGNRLVSQLERDAPGFVPVLFALIVLAALQSSENARPFVGPFITLALIAAILKKWPQISGQVSTAYNHYTTAYNHYATSVGW